MKIKPTLLALGALAIALILYFIPPKGARTSTDIRTSHETGSNTNKSPRIPDAGAGNSSLTPPIRNKLLDARTAGTLVAALESSDYSQGQKLYVRMQIENFCTPHNVAMPARKKTTSGDTIHSFQEKYCADYPYAGSPALSAILKIPESDPMSAVLGMTGEMSNALNQGNAGRAEAAVIGKALTDTMLSKDSGIEAYESARILHAFGYLSSDFLDLAKEEGWNLDLNDLSKAQLMGAQMRLCRNFGGCGPNQLFSMLLCMENSSCTPGITAQATWNRTGNPKIISAARQLSLRNRNRTPSQ